MNTYIEINNTFVNLSNISTIIFLKDQNRIVLNYSHGIELKKTNKIISDYIYMNFDSACAYNDGIRTLSENQFIANRFLKHQNGMLNKSKISSFKIENEKRRIIFNMSHGITIVNKTKENVLASEFVYVALPSDYTEYVNYVNYVKNALF